jgi:hypothetical protein
VNVILIPAARPDVPTEATSTKARLVAGANIPRPRTPNALHERGVSARLHRERRRRDLRRHRCTAARSRCPRLDPLEITLAANYDPAEACRLGRRKRDGSNA